MKSAKQRWSKNKVVEGIRVRAQVGAPLNYAAVVAGDESLAGEALRFWGSWDAALVAAGQEPGVIKHPRIDVAPPGTWSREVALERALTRLAAGASMVAHHVQSEASDLYSAAVAYPGRGPTSAWMSPRSRPNCGTYPAHRPPTPAEPALAVDVPVDSPAVCIHVHQRPQLALDDTDARALAERAARPDWQAAERALTAMLDAEEDLANSRLGHGHQPEQEVQLLVARLDRAARGLLDRYHEALVQAMATAQASDP